MSIVRVGTTAKYAEGWDSIFGGKKGAKSAAAKPVKKAAPSPKKKAAKKKAKK